MPRPLLSLLAAAALWAIPDPAGAAPVLRHQLLVNGDFALFGNTLAHDCGAGVAPVVGTVPSPANQCGQNRADSGVDVFWVSSTATSSAVASTANSAATSRSTAVLSLPARAVVRYARIYWAAQSAAAGYDGDARLTTPDGATATLTADHGVAITVRGGEHWYQSSADVTALLQALAEPRGAYTMSGVDSLDLVGFASETTFDAWWAVVFYEDPDDPSLRQLTLFDGLDFVEPGAPADVTVGGFLVPDGGFDAKLGVATYEGDGAWNGDSLFFQGYRSVDPEPTVLTTLADALNGATNFFNGSRGWLGVARSVAGDLPQMSGAAESMMSFDLDVVDLKAIGAIGPGHDTARIRATSALDVYALGAFVTSINTLKPSFIETVKTATNLTRGSGVFAGDLIEYTIDTQNTGNDPSIQTVMHDALPSGVSYVPGTLQITQGAGAGAKTDAAGDDQAEYVSSTHALTVRLGTGATAFVGGTMAIGETAQIVFRVTVNPGASGILQNQAEVIAAGQSGEPARTFDSTPPAGSGPTSLPVDQCLDDGHCGGATPACLAAATPNVCVGCTSAAYCGGATPMCDLAAHACVGLTTIAPASRDRTTVAGTSAPFPMTLTSNLAGADTYDLDVVDPGCGWGVELRDGGGTLLGTRDGAGAWTIAGGHDTDGGGRPDLGPTAGDGGTASFELRLTPPGGTPVGSSCTATLVATGLASGLVASATATLHVGAEATWTPAYVGGSAKAVSRGGDVGFPGVIQNNTGDPLTFALATTVTATPDQGALQAATFYSDPDGDGDPADGAAITSVGPVGPYGGRVHVVLVLHASTAAGTPLAIGTALEAASTAASGGVVASQAAEARVQFAATYSDAARTVVRGGFAPCDAVYLGAKLLPAGFPFALEWYAKAAPVRGTDAPVRTVDPWPVSGGTGTDELVVPADARGPWTVLVVQKTTPTATVLDTVPFEVERAGSFAAFAVPPRVGMSDGLSVTASVRNDNPSAAFDGSEIAYTVTDGASYLDGAGAFSATPGAAHLTSPVNAAAGATASDGWAIAAPAWPGPGVYTVDAEWRLQCGGRTQLIAPATTSFEVVPAPPAILSPADGALLSTGTPTFSGTALAGAAVTVTVGALGCGPVTAAGDGAWSCTPGASLGDGAHAATAVQAVGGVASDPSAAVGFTVDLTPPAVAISDPAEDALVGGAAAPGGAVAFSGSAEAGATVVVAVGAASAVAARSGATWTATLTLADGAHTATATATDAAGNAGTAQVSFALDTAAPAAPVVGAPADGATLTAADAPGGVVTISGTAEPGAAVAVTIGATTRLADRAGAAWSTSFTLDDDVHAVSATATDAAGNASSAATSSFTLDATAPAAPAFAFPLDGALLNAAQAPGGLLTLTGGTDSGTSVAVTVDGTPHAATVSGTGWSLTLTLGEGLHPASAVASDAVGNPSAPALVAFTLDLVAPPAPTLAAVPSPTRADPVSVTGDGDAGATVELFLDDVSQGTAVAGPAFSFSLAGVPAGPHTVFAVARDAAGNPSDPSVARAFVVDRTPPGLPTVDAPADGALLGPVEAPGGVVAFSGTSELGTTVEVEVDGLVLAVADASDGTWSASVALLDGPHQVRARAADAAGNVGDFGAASAFALDTAGPLAPALDALASPTAAPTITVTGVADVGTVVAVYLDAVLVGTVTADSGAFSLEVAVTEGTRTFTATATDGSGNVSAPSLPVAVLVDRTAPPAPTLDPEVTPTNAATVAFSGTAEAGALVALYCDAVLAGTVAAPSGAFSLEVAVTEGSHDITATATDGAGNVSALSGALELLVDRAAPAAPSLDPLGSPTSATSVAVSGAAEAGATVTVFRDGAPVGAVLAAAGTFSLDVPVAEGSRSFTATAADPAGNVSAHSGAVTVMVDRTAPSAPVLAALVSPTNATSVTVSGTAEDGAIVTIFRDGSPVGDVAATGGEFSLAVPVFAGTVSFTASAADAAGNVSARSDAAVVVVDHAVPAAPVLDPLLTPTNAAGVAVTGSADAGTDVTVYLDGLPVGTVAAPGGTFTLAVPLPEGTSTFTATAADAAGNVSPTSNAVQVAVDRTAPDAPLLAPLDSPTGAGTVTVSGSAEAGAAVSVYLDAVAVGTVVAAGGTFSLDVAVTEGLRTFVATATDAAGNVSLDSGAVTVLVDHTLPAPPALAALASPTNATTVAVSGTAEPGSTVTVFLDGAFVATVAAPAGAFAVVVAVPEGTLAITATSADAVGNASGASNTVTVVVDRTAPPAGSIVAPADGALLGAAVAPGGVVAFSGTAEAGSTVEVEVDLAVTTVAAGAPSGGWALSRAVLDGAHQVRVRAIDAAGNAGPWSGLTPFTVDTTAPLAPSLDALASPTNAATLAVSGAAEAGSVVTVYLDGSFAGTTLAAGGTFSLAVPVTDGTRTFTATAVDPAGNASLPSAPRSVAVDLVAPAAPVLTSPAEAQVLAPGAVVLAGSAEAGAAVTVLVGGTTLGAVAAADGTFSVEVTLPAGSWIATAVATDAAGNASPATSLRFSTAAPGGGGGEISGGGGCGCSEAGGASSSSVVLLALALALAPRRRWALAGARRRSGDRP